MTPTSSTTTTESGTWHDLWAVPILTRHVDPEPSFNPALRALILRHQTEAAGDAAGVVDADKTRSDLLRWNAPLIDPLREWITDAAEALNRRVGAGTDARGRHVDMVAEAWAVTYRRWGYHRMHSHHDAAWSGVYYVHTGDDTGHGLIEWLDPRPAACAREHDRPPLRSFAPRPGTLIAFPAWLRHHVTPHEGEKERIVVAFNIGFRQ